jgi:alkylation response protein AidB-like acyl-CoA dehydrogenase
MKAQEERQQHGVWQEPACYGIDIGWQETVRSFAETHIVPYAVEWDKAEELPRDLLNKIGEQGFFGSIFPKEYGGLGRSYVDYVCLLRQLAMADPTTALLVESHTSLCSNHIYLFGTDEQRNAYLPRLATGQMLGCWSLTEKGAGSDAAAIATHARREGEEWLVNGNKRFISNASIAGVNIVLAVTTPGAGKEGISAFIVDCDNPGRILGERLRTLGMRASHTHEILYRECRLKSDALLGKAGEGFRQALRVLDSGRIAIAALSVGLAQGAYEAALGYAEHRKQFGKRLADFPVIQDQLVEMVVATKSAWLLTLEAAARTDAGTLDPGVAAMAKLAASEAAISVSEKSLHIHGGNGYIRGNLSEKYFRDARLCVVGEGTSEILRLVIARQILGARGRSASES